MIRIAWTTIFPFVLPSITGTTGACHHALLLLQKWSWELFSPEHPGTMILLISALQVTMIIGLSHHAQPTLILLVWKQRLRKDVIHPCPCS
jgi:hypothetical protein